VANSGASDNSGFSGEIRQRTQTLHALQTDPQTLARPVGRSRDPDSSIGIGGSKNRTPPGNINYEPLNHETWCASARRRSRAVAQEIPNMLPAGDPEGDLLIVAWGSTSGSMTAGIGKPQRAQGPQNWPFALALSQSVASNLGDIFKRYKKILVPELNMGQLLWVLRAKYLVDAVGLNKSGRPFKQAELEQKNRRNAGTLGRTIMGPQLCRRLSRRRIFRPTRKCVVPGVRRSMPFSPRYRPVFSLQLGSRKKISSSSSGIGCSCRFPYYMNTLVSTQFTAAPPPWRLA